MTAWDVKKVTFVVRNIRLSGLEVDLPEKVVEDRPLTEEEMKGGKKDRKERKKGKGKNSQGVKRKREDEVNEAKAKRKAKY